MSESRSSLPPVLSTTRLLLRPLRLEDALDMYEYASDEDVAHAGLWQPLASLEGSRNDILQVLHQYALVQNQRSKVE